jgi:hypothetical protein
LVLGNCVLVVTFEHKNVTSDGEVLLVYRNVYAIEIERPASQVFPGPSRKIDSYGG